ncbi:hypothetical protein [Streptomyces sp. MNP-20]|uniref:hypothetical protein n=1 Tax=Streptomyces sp. MNP-20 TaxID=2721165 RepID=UPI00155378E3|nr:hypothetical protein [Streptomyces sp. MNP-20]
MTPRSPSRRSLLRGAGAAALTAGPIALAAPATAAPSPAPRRPSRRGRARVVAAGVRDKMTWWDATSTAAPTVYQPNNVPLLAWRGNRNSRNITLANVIGPRLQFAGSSLQKTILGAASDYAPVFLPQLSPRRTARLAWTGLEQRRLVHVGDFALTDDLRLTGEMTEQTPMGSGQLNATSGPDLSWLQRHRVNVLDENGRVAFAQARDMTFDEALPLPFLGSPRGPVRNRGLNEPGALWAWTAADGALCFALTRSPVPTTESPTVARSAQSSICEPSRLLPYGSSLYIAWTGIDGAGRLNIAPVDVEAVRAGNDPIGTVYTLPENSLAAPAVEVQIDVDSGRSRLVAFWTGTDGTGALNACEVLLP